VFGALAAKLKKSQRDSHVRINDLWLAAQAIQRNLKPLTSNPRDFKDIPGLKMVALPRPL
jgi:predicted nucleic acid-binding protein